MKKLTLANILSASRFFTSPLMVLFAYQDNVTGFLIALVLSWFTDTIDGTVARMMKQTSRLGNLLDTYADNFYQASSIISLYLFFPEYMQSVTWVILTALGFYMLNRVLSYVRFGKVLYPHLITTKVPFHTYFAFILVSLYRQQAYPLLFEITMAIMFIFLIEEAVIFMLLKEPREDIHSIFEIL